MYQGPVVFTDTIASGAATSSGINLQRCWNQVSVCVSTMSTAAAINVSSSPDGGVTFFPVYYQNVATSAVQGAKFSIISGVGTSSGFVPMVQCGSYLQFVATAVVSGGVSFKIVCQSD